MAKNLFGDGPKNARKTMRGPGNAWGKNKRRKKRRKSRKSKRSMF